MKPVKRCNGITKAEDVKYLPSYYCATHETYTFNPDELCKECLRRKQEDTLWCKLINDFD